MDTLIRIAATVGILLATLAPAHAQPFEASPQWMRTLEFEVAATDTPSMGQAPSWATLPDGDIVVATRGDEAHLLLRRIAPDGSIHRSARASAPLPDPGNTFFVVRTDAASGDILVLAGAQTYCALHRFDSGFVRRWQVVLPVYPQMATCMDLAVLDDGSAIALQHGGLSRIGTDGSVAWTISNGDDGRYLVAHAMALGADGVIWIAGRGDLIAQGGNHVAVQRFTPAGLRLPVDTIACTGCIGTIPTDMTRAANGDVFVVGRGTSPQKGFLARYAADGTRLILVERESIGYRKVEVDDGGRVYAHSGIGEVHRVDPADGAVLWDRPADDIVEGVDGVVAVRLSQSGSELVAAQLDSDGEPSWQATLSGFFSPGFSIPPGFRAGAHARWLMGDAAGAPNACGSRVRFLSLALADGDVVETRFCAMPAQARAVALDVREGTGSLITTEHHLAAFTPDGMLRWQVETCPLCLPRTAGYSSWVDAVLREDGGAWAIEAVRETSGISSPLALYARRIGADGVPTLSFALGSESLSIYGLVIRRSTDDGLVVLRSTANVPNTRVEYRRFDAGGQLVASEDHSMPDPNTSLRSARMLPDGGISFASMGDVICFIGCPPFYVGVTRLGAAGNIVWQAFFEESVETNVALEADGSASALFRGAAGVLHRRGFAADGTVGPDMPVNGLDLLAWIEELSPAVDDRQTVAYSAPSSSGVALMDAEGNIVATRTLYPHNRPLVLPSPHGFLTTDSILLDADADLLSAGNLETRVRFRFPGSALPTSTQGAYVYGRWSMPDDGSVYGATTVIDANGARQLAIARFNVPGSAADRIFTHGFDGD